MTNQTHQAEILKKLVSLRQGYKQKLSHEIRHINEAHDWLLQGNWDQQKAADLHCLLHKLAGAAGTFGFKKIGQAARKGETVLKDFVAGDTKPDSEQSKLLAGYLSRITELYKKISLDSSELNIELTAHHYVEAEDEDNENRLVFLLAADAVLAKDLVRYLGYYGYRTMHFENSNTLKQELKKIEPIAVICDIVMPDGNGLEIVENIQRERKKALPVIFVSIEQDMTTRLQAVRAGGIAYFGKPVDPTRVVDTLDSLVNRMERKPNRILIIEDSRSLAEFYSFILKQAGMETLTINDPMLVMRPLEEFRPDLILMDLYMPGCTGLELAKIIRQQEAFHSIPIVYLSVETDTDIQMEAMRPGGDEFLTKPIKPGHLVSSVNSRVRRARILRSFMVRDSLTGLYNHTLTKEYLSMEVAQAKRRNGILSFAMIDLDNFKSVNDTYGHPAGDEVIKNIAKFLSQRMRKSDIIGRYGGEEFAVIMPDTSAEDATHIMDTLRNDFSQISQRYGDYEITVTFSCGVADFPSCPDPAALSEVADQALYEAKNSGRNQVVKAEHIHDLSQQEVR